MTPAANLVTSRTQRRGFAATQGGGKGGAGGGGDRVPAERGQRSCSPCVAVRVLIYCLRPEPPVRPPPLPPLRFGADTEVPELHKAAPSNVARVLSAPARANSPNTSRPDTGYNAAAAAAAAAAVADACSLESTRRSSAPDGVGGAGRGGARGAAPLPADSPRRSHRVPDAASRIPRAPSAMPPRRVLGFGRGGEKRGGEGGRRELTHGTNNCDAVAAPKYRAGESGGSDSAAATVAAVAPGRTRARALSATRPGADDAATADASSARDASAPIAAMAGNVATAPAPRWDSLIPDMAELSLAVINGQPIREGEAFRVRRRVSALRALALTTARAEWVSRARRPRRQSTTRTSAAPRASPRLLHIRSRTAAGRPSGRCGSSHRNRHSSAVPPENIPKNLCSNSPFVLLSGIPIFLDPPIHVLRLPYVTTPHSLCGPTVRRDVSRGGDVVVSCVYAAYLRPQRCRVAAGAGRPPGQGTAEHGHASRGGRPGHALVAGGRAARKAAREARSEVVIARFRLVSPRPAAPLRSATAPSTAAIATWMCGM
ncbi:Protein of unknown function [Gryllus bimaculatus]|nr:Protein of unknown function [Gryllus bimaculatus]